MSSDLTTGIRLKNKKNPLHTHTHEKSTQKATNAKQIEKIHVSTYHVCLRTINTEKDMNQKAGRGRRKSRFRE